MERQIEQIQKQLDKIIDNELVHLKADIGELREEIGILRTNVSWILKFFWIIVTASIGTMATTILGLILK